MWAGLLNTELNEIKCEYAPWILLQYHLLQYQDLKIWFILAQEGSDSDLDESVLVLS